MPRVAAGILIKSTPEKKEIENGRMEKWKNKKHCIHSSAAGLRIRRLSSVNCQVKIKTRRTIKTTKIRNKTYVCQPQNTIGILQIHD